MNFAEPPFEQTARDAESGGDVADAQIRVDVGVYERERTTEERSFFACDMEMVRCSLTAPIDGGWLKGV